MPVLCSSAPCEQHLAQRFDALDAAQQQLLDELRTVESKINAISEMISYNRSARAKSVPLKPLGLGEMVAEDDAATPENSRSLALIVESGGQGSETSLAFQERPSKTRSIRHSGRQSIRNSRRSITEGSRLESPSGAASLTGDSSVLHRMPGMPGRRPSSGLFHTSLTGDWSHLRIRQGYDTCPSRRSSSRICEGGSQRRKSRVLLRKSHRMDLTDLNPSWKAWNPDSISRTVFEATSMVMLLYDAFVVPYRLAWSVSVDGIAFAVVLWMTRLFWTADLILNGFTGFRDSEAKLVLNINRTFRHYLTTWFLPDLTLVSCDWLTIALAPGNNWQQWMRVMRLIRGGRQLLRGWTLVEKAKLVVQDKSFHLMMDISLLMIVILWVNHMVCCGWYSIGRYSMSDTGLTWLSTEEYAAGGPYYEYLTALHWSMTQMTPGSMEVTPKSSGERIYNVGILLLGLLMGSSLVATLTSMMTQYKLRIEGSSRKFMILHQYLHQESISPELAMAIKLQVKARSKETMKLKAKDVEYLGLLSNSLQDALWHAGCTRYSQQHPLLNALDLIDAYAMQSICKTCIKAMDFILGDLVFEEGQIGEFMYFVAAGCFRYNPGELAPEVHLMETDPRLELKPQEWCSEPALWTVWTHLGALEAETTSEIMSLSAQNLLNTVNRFPDLFGAVQDYCATFHKHINEPGVVQSDLAYALDNCELIAGLSAVTRMQFAAPVIHRLEARFMSNALSRNKLQLLKEEVNNGKCDIGLQDKEIVRNTFVVALRLRYAEDSEGRFLVKMGEELRGESHCFIPSCHLPGVKRQWRESYITAVDRLIAHDLGEFSSSVDTHFLEGSEQNVIMQDSPTYGIRTRYLKTTFNATLADDAKLRLLTVNTKSLRPSHTSHLTWLLRQESRRRLQAERDVVSVLAEQTEAVVLHCALDNRAVRKVYLWLNRYQFEVLNGDRAKPIIEQWLQLVPDSYPDRDPPKRPSTPVGIVVGREENGAVDLSVNLEDEAKEAAFTL